MYNDRGNFFLALGPAASLIVIHVLAVARLRFVACPGSRATRGPHASAYSWHMPSIGTRRGIHEDVDRIYGMHPGT